MGLVDKMKAAAQDVATQAKTATAQAQTKIEQAQTRRKMDEAAQRLGYLVHGERVRGTAAGPEVDRLIAEISTLETELAASEGAEPVGSAPEAPAAASAPPATGTGAGPDDDTPGGSL